MDHKNPENDKNFVNQMINALDHAYENTLNDLKNTTSVENKVFCNRKNLNKLLALLKLDFDYSDGAGDFLFANGHKIIDATGGYGANLLGHKNPEIINTALDAIIKSAPSHLQASYRKSANQLAFKINELLKNELNSKENFQTIFTNSGTESVEAAIKFSLMRHHHIVSELKIELTKNHNLNLKFIEDNKEDKKVIALILELFNASGLDEVITILNDNLHNNFEILAEKPKLIALKNSFHGKTLGSLQATYNPQFRKFYFLDNSTLFIDKNKESAEEAIRKCQRKLQYFNLSQNSSVFIKEISKCHALILEPIQGEAGLIPLSAEFVQFLQRLMKINKALFISDEIQAGCFRTGKFTSLSNISDIPADIYTFSKSLGAGIAKIGAVSISEKIDTYKFDINHTSTFSEDHFSCTVALKALEILSQNKELILDKSNIFSNKFFLLKDKFSKYIHDIRINGLMIAIELNKEIAKHSYEFKFFYDMGHLGNLFTSAFLHNENLRTNTTLSNQLTFRIQPSIYISEENIDKIINSFEHLFTAIHENNAQYFFKHLFSDDPSINIGEFNNIKTNIDQIGTHKKKAVFLNHPITTNDLKKIATAFKNVPDELLEEIILDNFESLKFCPYYTTTIQDNYNENCEIVMLSIPIPSHLLKKLMHSKKSHLLQEKLQDAIIYSKEIGANTVGLGQFTSIISHNGLNLDNNGLNLTTGNPYTAMLSVEAVKNQIDKNNSLHRKLAIFGITGNIMGQAAKLIARDCHEVAIYHYESIIRSKKLQNALIDLLVFLRNDGDFKHSHAIPDLITPDNIVSIIESLSFITLKTKYCLEDQCNVFMLGTNTSDILLNNDDIERDSIILDLGVPHNLDPRLLHREDITVILGGIAQFPNPSLNTKIEIPSFPLKKGELFACMSETFTLALNTESKTLCHIGDVTITQMEEIKKLATKSGFILKSNKNINSM